MFCPKCGTPTKENERFCMSCGAALTPIAPQTTDAVSGQVAAAQMPVLPQKQPIQQQPQTPPPAYAPQQQPVYTQPAKKSSKAWLIVLCAVLGTALIAAGIVFLTGGFGAPAMTGQSMPAVEYSYLSIEKAVDIDFKYPEAIYPSLYSSMDSVLNFHATSEGGNTEVLVKVEIPGFTQAYEQKLTLTEQITQIYVKPPVLTGYLDLSSSKDAQIIFSVTDTSTGNPYVQESVPVKLMSKYDFILWEDEFGASNMDNALAWLTPESEGILELRRRAISWLDDATDGAFNTLAGYQYSSLFGPDEYYNNVLYQVLGLQGAMSDMGVRYNVGAFSMTEGAHQRVLLPDDVLYSQSGICFETSLVMASALQSLGMHVMLVFPPGHAQVAVETWDGSGEYYLIETTILPYTAEDAYSSVVQYMDSAEWEAYLADPWGGGSGSCYVVDCDFATKLGITALSN